MNGPVAITGGTGFIGSRLALSCLERGVAVSVLGQENTPAESANLSLIREAGARVSVASVTDPDAVAAFVSGADTVVHLAAAQHEMSISDRRFHEVNVGGTRHVLDASAGAGVRRVVYGSTIGVYGVTDGPVDETSDCRPHNIYGRTKLEAERLALETTSLETVAVRIPEIYGPGDRRLLKLFRALAAGRFVRIGSGRNVHDVLFVGDLVEALLTAATHPDAAGEVFQLGGPSPVTTDEMIDAVAEAVGTDPPRRRVPLWPLLAAGTVLELTLRPLGIQPPLHRRRLDFFRNSFELRTDRVRSVLGFEPAVSFAEGARATAEWYRAEGMIS